MTAPWVAAARSRTTVVVTNRESVAETDAPKAWPEMGMPKQDGV
jgi:hypothetical protein